MTTTHEPKRVRTLHLQRFKDEGRPFTMLTSYDALTARVFDRAGVDTLLIGDSIGNNVLGYPNTLRVSLQQIADATAAVSGAVERALVVADMPFGSYEASDEQAVNSAVELMKAGAHAVKLEGGQRIRTRIAAIVDAGIPVVGHLGFTPQSEQRLGGFRIQGRDEQSVAELTADALAVQEAGAIAVVLEMVAGEAAREITAQLRIPTIGIGAGNGTDGQVLVWTDFAGLNTQGVPRFVKQYADVAGVLTQAAEAYISDVRDRAFPDEAHTY